MDKHGFIMLSTFEINKHPYQLNLFDDNFNHPHVIVDTCSPENSPKSHNFFPYFQ